RTRPLVPLPTARIQLDLEDLDPVLRRLELFVLELAHRVRLLHDEGDQPLEAEADRGQQRRGRGDDAGPIQRLHRSPPDRLDCVSLLPRCPPVSSKATIRVHPPSRLASSRLASPPFCSRLASWHRPSRQVLHA